MNNCANPNCNHSKENHINVDGTNKAICNGSLECTCEFYKEQYLAVFLAEVEVHKAKRWSIYKRCEYILKKIPQTRNAGEKTFYKIYIEIWYGFKIRATGTSLTTKEWKRLPNQDTVNREKRRVKALQPELATYDGKVLEHQQTIFEACVQMAIEA